MMQVRWLLNCKCAGFFLFLPVPLTSCLMLCTVKASKAWMCTFVVPRRVARRSPRGPFISANTVSGQYVRCLRLALARSVFKWLSTRKRSSSSMYRLIAGGDNSGFSSVNRYMYLVGQNRLQPTFSSNQRCVRVGAARPSFVGLPVFRPRLSAALLPR